MSDAGAGATEAEVEHEKHLHRADTRRVMRNKYRKLQRQVLGTERCTRTQGLLRRHTGMWGGGTTWMVKIREGDKGRTRRTAEANALPPSSTNFNPYSKVAARALEAACRGSDRAGAPGRGN